MDVVLVTGCSSGIGLETALAFARRGDKVIASMRDVTRSGLLRERAASEQSTVDVVPLDVTDDESVRMAFADVEERYGPVDVLVNNAGISPWGPMELMDWTTARAAMETNFWGPVRTMRAVVPSMRARRSGVIVNVSSGVDRLPAGPWLSTYTASKHALAVMGESVAMEVAQFGIRVICIEPGYFRTNIGSTMSWPYPDDEPYGQGPMDFWNGVQAGVANGTDPSVAADAIVRAVDEVETPSKKFIR